MPRPLVVHRKPQAGMTLCTLAEDETLFKTGFTVAPNQRPPTHKLEPQPRQTSPLIHAFMHAQTHTAKKNQPESALACLPPSSLLGSVLWHPPAGAVHQGGPWKCVPQGGTERAPGQRRESHRHKETRGERGDQAARTQEVLANQRLETASMTNQRK